MKTKFWIIIGIALAILILLLILRGNEDSWIKDERGVWVKHGNPSSVPSYVLEQQIAINDASRLYNITLERVKTFDIFSSDRQELGNSSDGKYGIYVLWIPENGSLDFQRYSDLLKTGAPNLIFLDREGNVVKVINKYLQ